MDPIPKLVDRMKGGSSLDGSDRMISLDALQTARDILGLPATFGTNVNEEVGRGSFGVVFAYSGDADQDGGVVKIPWPDVPGDAKHLQRWAQELRIGAQLHLEDPNHRWVVGYRTIVVRVPGPQGGPPDGSPNYHRGVTGIVEISAPDIASEEGVFGTMPRADGVLGRIEDWSDCSPVERLHLAVDVMQSGIQGVILFQSTIRRMAKVGQLREVTKTISHADVRPQNVLLFKDPTLRGRFRPVLSDFGCARGIPGRMASETGSTQIEGLPRPSTIPHVDIGLFSRGWFRPFDPEGDARDDIRGIAACALLAFLGKEPTWLPRTLNESRDRGPIVQIPGRQPHTRLNRKRTFTAFMSNPDVEKAIALLPSADTDCAKRLLNEIVVYLCAESLSLPSYLQGVNAIRRSDSGHSLSSLFAVFIRHRYIVSGILALVLSVAAIVVLMSTHSPRPSLRSLYQDVGVESMAKGQGYLGSYVSHGMYPSLIQRDDLALLNTWDEKTEIFLIFNMARRIISDDWYVKFVANRGHAPSISVGGIKVRANTTIPVDSMINELELILTYSRFVRVMPAVTTLVDDHPVSDVIIACELIESFPPQHEFTIKFEVQEVLTRKILATGVVSTSTLEAWSDLPPLVPSDRHPVPNWLLDPSDGGRWKAVLGATKKSLMGYHQQRLNLVQSAKSSFESAYGTSTVANVQEQWVDDQGNVFAVFGVPATVQVPR